MLAIRIVIVIKIVNLFYITRETVSSIKWDHRIEQIKYTAYYFCDNTNYVSITKVKLKSTVDLHAYSVLTEQRIKKNSITDPIVIVNKGSKTKAETS